MTEDCYSTRISHGELHASIAFINAFKTSTFSIFFTIVIGRLKNPWCVLLYAVLGYFKYPPQIYRTINSSIDCRPIPPKSFITPSFQCNYKVQTKAVNKAKITPGQLPGVLRQPGERSRKTGSVSPGKTPGNYPGRRETYLTRGSN